jgi:hypothetical protein
MIAFGALWTIGGSVAATAIAMAGVSSWQLVLASGATVAGLVDLGRGIALRARTS